MFKIILNPSYLFVKSFYPSPRVGEEGVHILAFSAIMKVEERKGVERNWTN
jgi:hypothetical protein